VSDEFALLGPFDVVVNRKSATKGIATMTRATAPVGGGTAAALLGVVAGCWAVAIGRMHGMDTGAATALGSFGSFVGRWVPMMAAMMLPGALPAVSRLAHWGTGVGRTVTLLCSYLAVWSLVGVVLYGVYRPHGTSVAGGVVLAAGFYELTPAKRHWRRCCRERIDSGFVFGACCVGSSIGLMAMMAALGVMSVTWMAVIAVLVLGQKLLDARAVIDLPLAFAIVALGLLIIVHPSSVPGLTPAM
jgi:predicted metal-binding membrane protein